jgi:hypothetical protein
MFFTSVRLPGLDGLLLTGGYYDLRFTQTSDGWRISSLFEDNRWMQPVASVPAPGLGGSSGG